MKPGAALVVLAVFSIIVTQIHGGFLREKRQGIEPSPEAFSTAV